MYIFYFVDFGEENLMDTTSPEILAVQKEIDSLRLAKIESQKPKLYPFNPNFITDFKGYTLGMSLEEIDRLHAFREQNKWINSIEDFKNVTKASDSLLAIIGPSFKFPDWLTDPKPQKAFFKNDYSEKPLAQKNDLNHATEAQLQEVSGIGEAFSKRIISYREKLGGFVDDSQLYDVYGLEAAVVQRTLNQFTVKTPKKVPKMSINTATASDIATIPGISFELAKKIWEYRTLHQGVDSFEELDGIEGLTPRKLQLIQLYLSLDHFGIN